ncbi:MAG: hypothetical protein ACR2PI_06190 [Hyphomicrobiaceae bacterium]
MIACRFDAIAEKIHRNVAEVLVLAEREQRTSRAVAEQLAKQRMLTAMSCRRA